MTIQEIICSMKKDTGGLYEDTVNDNCHSNLIGIALLSGKIMGDTCRIIEACQAAMEVISISKTEVRIELKGEGESLHITVRIHEND